MIRNEEARHLIIQGVAGSGKTSIALHRIAFLLYRFKNTISSQDILIISPNKVFASYISNVLPELGEEEVAEKSMEEIADVLLEYKIMFKNFFDQVAELLSNHDSDLAERIQFKSSKSLLKKMDEYLRSLEKEGFKPHEIVIKNKPVPAWFIEESFQKYSRFPLLKRFNEVVQDVVNKVSFYYKYEIKGRERTELHKTIRKMFPSVNLRMIYKGFYRWTGRPELLKVRKGNVYEWNDVFPLIYMKMKLEGIHSDRKVKHLVIDEMQDYFAVQYMILRTLYPCKKTILGDINQCVNPFASSNSDSIQNIFPDAEAVTMLKSYRSTYEITEFTKKIINKEAVEAIKRHGDPPETVKCENANDEMNKIQSIIKNFHQSDYNSMGIICKTQKQANHLYGLLKDSYQISLFNAASIVFGSGIAITTAYMAKGLEFDRVLVPEANEKNYNSETDRHMLYVACTRAMHQLYLTYTDPLSSFLKNR
ncbi:MAG TPA: helicase [bacterium]|nr:helicase [bacterium]